MIKTLVFFYSLAMLLSIAAVKIDAQEPELEYKENRLSPSALVNAARKGGLKDWNIPSYGQLQSSYDSGRITANDLIGAAIEAGKLSPQAAEDDKYINSVDAELKQLHED